MRKLWYEKYRPQTLDDFVFSGEYEKEMFTTFVKEGDIPNLLISGIQGTGKTTMARILINEMGINKMDVKTINASSESGIDTVRSKIDTFTKTIPMGKFKVVLLEEADGLSNQAQKALRALIEETSDNVRYIFTCNYENKIITPLHSRLQHVHITQLDKDAVTERVAYILENEGVVIDDVDDVFAHINAYYPDMRKIINSLQESSIMGSLHGVIGKSAGSEDLEAWEEAWKDPDKEMLMEIAANMDLSNMQTVFRIMYDNLDKLPESLRDNATVTIAEHLYKSSFVADQEINLMACIILLFEE